MTDDLIPIHLRPLPTDTVTDLCDRASRAAPDSYTIQLEINGFRDSRTPWDAMRLANVLDRYDPASLSVKELVAELDRVAHEAAGLVPEGRSR